MTHETLQNLIFSLDQGERQYWYAGAFMSTGKWVKERKLVMQTLLNQKDYDPKALEIVFKRKKYGKLLTQEKHLMSKALITSLREYRRLNQPETDPMTLYDEARMMLDRGLRDHASNLCLKALDKAMKVEDLFAELHLRELLRVIYKASATKKLSRAETDNEYRLVTVADKVGNLVRYNTIGDSLNALHLRYNSLKHPVARKAMESLMADPLMQNLANAQSLPAQIRFANTWALYHQDLGDAEKAEYFMQMCLQLWESNPERIAYKPRLYLSTLTNLAGSRMQNGDYASVPDLLQRCEKVPVTVRLDAMISFCELELQYQILYMNTGQLENALAREVQVNEGISFFGRVMRESVKLCLWYNLGICYLVMDRMEEAKNYFTAIFQLGELRQRIDIQGLARLLRLLMILELNDHEHFHHFMRRNKPFFTTDHPYFTMENIVFDWLHEHAASFNTESAPETLQLLYDALAPFQKEGINGAEELRLWAKSRITGTPIRQLAYGTSTPPTPN
jgi:tetratricopeptide (TPR) repeat protein